MMRQKQMAQEGEMLQQQQTAQQVTQVTEEETS